MRVWGVLSDEFWPVHMATKPPAQTRCELAHCHYGRFLWPRSALPGRSPTTRQPPTFPVSLEMGLHFQNVTVKGDTLVSVRASLSDTSHVGFPTAGSWRHQPRGMQLTSVLTCVWWRAVTPKVKGLSPTTPRPHPTSFLCHLRSGRLTVNPRFPWPHLSFMVPRAQEASFSSGLMAALLEGPSRTPCTVRWWGQRAKSCEPQAPGASVPGSLVMKSTLLAHKCIWCMNLGALEPHHSGSMEASWRTQCIRSSAVGNGTQPLADGHNALGHLQWVMELNL